MNDRTSPSVRDRLEVISGEIEAPSASWMAQSFGPRGSDGRGMEEQLYFGDNLNSPWWVVQELNLRPRARQARALPS